MGLRDMKPLPKATELFIFFLSFRIRKRMMISRINHPENENLSALKAFRIENKSS